MIQLKRILASVLTAAMVMTTLSGCEGFWEIQQPEQDSSSIVQETPLPGGGGGGGTVGGGEDDTPTAPAITEDTAATTAVSSQISGILNGIASSGSSDDSPNEFQVVQISDSSVQQQLDLNIQNSAKQVVDAIQSNPSANLDTLASQLSAQNSAALKKNVKNLIFLTDTLPSLLSTFSLMQETVTPDLNTQIQNALNEELAELGGKENASVYYDVYVTSVDDEEGKTVYIVFLTIYTQYTVQDLTLTVKKSDTIAAEMNAQLAALAEQVTDFTLTFTPIENADTLFGGENGPYITAQEQSFRYWYGYIDSSDETNAPEGNYLNTVANQLWSNCQKILMNSDSSYEPGYNEATDSMYSAVAVSCLENEAEAQEDLLAELARLYNEVVSNYAAGQPLQVHYSVDCSKVTSGSDTLWVALFVGQIRVDGEAAEEPAEPEEPISIAAKPEGADLIAGHIEEYAKNTDYLTMNRVKDPEITAKLQSIITPYYSELISTIQPIENGYRFPAVPAVLNALKPACQQALGLDSSCFIEPEISCVTYTKDRLQAADTYFWSSIQDTLMNGDISQYHSSNQESGDELVLNYYPSVYYLEQGEKTLWVCVIIAYADPPAASSEA